MVSKNESCLRDLDHQEPSPVVLIRSRRKTLALYIKPDGSLEARAPLFLSKSKIEQFIASKSRWIEKKRAQIAAREVAGPRELPPLQYESMNEFERIARETVDAWAYALKVSVAYVGFRTMATRWGSCTSKTRRIRLNTALAYCPRRCLEYLVVHELAHLIECNHSPRFWAIVADALPDYKARQKLLKQHSWLLKEANI